LAQHRETILYFMSNILYACGKKAKGKLENNNIHSKRTNTENNKTKKKNNIFALVHNKNAQIV